MAHTVVDDIHKQELFALTAGSSVILSNGHRLCFASVRIWNEYRERELLAHTVVALTQFLQLLLCDMQFLSCFEADRVDQKVGVYMVSVGVSADQNFMTGVVLCQLESCGVSSQRINILALREALDHVIEQNTDGFVVEIFRCHEISVDSLRSAVDTCDQLLTVEHSLLILHDIVHHRAHASF